MTTTDNMVRILSSFEVTSIPQVQISSGSATTLASKSWALASVDTIKTSFLLPEDWDGQGSPPPTVAASQIAAELAVRLAEKIADKAPVSVGATTDGGFEFEWGSNLWHAVVEVGGDGSLTGWYDDPERGLVDLI